MAVKIRLQRRGAKHAPVYRMVAADSRSPRDGRFVEILGTYTPKATKEADRLSLKADRIDYWLSVGAQPTDTARSLIKQARIAKSAEPEPAVEDAIEEAVAAPDEAIKAETPVPEATAPEVKEEIESVAVTDTEEAAAPEAAVEESVEVEAEAATEEPVAESKEVEVEVKDSEEATPAPEIEAAVESEAETTAEEASEPAEEVSEDDSGAEDEAQTETEEVESEAVAESSSEDATEKKPEESA